MRTLFASAAILLLASIIVTGQNCGGTRFRSYKLDVSLGTVMSQLDAIQSSGASSLDSTGAAALASFQDLLATEGSILYYAEAPGSMGSVQTVLPSGDEKNPTLFHALGIEVPAKAYVYFVFLNAQDGGHGAILITSGSADGSSQTPVFAMTSDGNSSPGIFTDTDFGIWMNTADGEVVLRTQDVVDYDLADTIQFEMMDAADEDIRYGFINLVQPL